MGWNAAVVVLVDRLNEIEGDPKFGKKLADAIRHQACPPPGGSEPYVTGQTHVVSVMHADVMQVVAVGGNTGRVLGHGYWNQSDEDLIKGLSRTRVENDAGGRKARDYRAAFGRALKAARQTAGLTQLELAEKAGTSQRRVSAYEAGDMEIRLAAAKRFADALGTRLRDLLPPENAAAAKEEVTA